MRFLPALLPVVFLVAGGLPACSFDPNIPNARILCKDRSDCPQAYDCEAVPSAPIEGVKICCRDKGCAQRLDAVQLGRILEAASNLVPDAGNPATTDGSGSGFMPGDMGGMGGAGGTCGNGVREGGETCDPLTTCPTTCTPNGCRLRRLANPGTCQAACMDDVLQTTCMNGDNCCPQGCNASNDQDCRPSCGNDVVETGETCDPASACPTTCPAVGCTKQRLEGTAAACTSRCLDGERQTMCASGDRCCPMGCTAANDSDCMGCTCGNGTVEASCGETCDPLASCPAACPAMGCQLRRLVNPGTCQAQCVNDRLQTMCTGGDNCCPPSCNATNDSDCMPRCGNGAVESGEQCDPVASCPTTCPWMGCMRRKLEGTAAACTARCVADGMQTMCARGDGCCPPGCNSTNDNDCSASCGNGVVEGNEKCDGNCPTSCPAMGCQRRRLQGSAAACSAECVNDTAITTCTPGDGCCPGGCTSVNDSDCMCRCGNGVVEAACNERCEGAACPTACPAMGCQQRRLEGSAAACTAQCVNAEVRTTCMNGDGCCPPACHANNDNDCRAECGNGVVESGETCDPPATSCQPQFDMCVDDANNDRTRTGMVAACTFRCTSVPRPCGGAMSDGFCPAACMPCGGATCAAGQDADCKKPAGSACTANIQCATACTDFYRDADGDGQGVMEVTKLCGAANAPPAGYAATAGGDCCDTDPLVKREFMSMYFTARNRCGNYDYNCMNGDEKVYGVFSCTLPNCDGGTTAVVNCGDPGTYRGCQYMDLPVGPPFCQEANTTSTVTQRCH